MKTLYFLNGKNFEHLTDQIIDLHNRKVQLEAACYGGMKEMTGKKSLFPSEIYLEKCTKELEIITQKREKLLDQMSEKAVQQASLWQMFGKEWMNSSQYAAWEMEVIRAISGVYCGYDIASSLEIMTYLENEGKLRHALYLLKKQQHSAHGYQRVRELILNYSSMGPEFYEGSKLGPLSDEEKDKIRNIRSSREALIVPLNLTFQKRKKK